MAESLPRLLATYWGLAGSEVAPLGGGMNSATASVRVDGDSLVAKWSADAAGLESGCAAAATLAGRGIVTGEPLPTVGGDLVISLHEGALALLRHVPGRELAGDSDREQVLIGTTLARVHAAGEPARGVGPLLTEWFEPSRRVLRVADWLGPTLATVHQEYVALPPLTWSQLHTDPAPEAFVHDDMTGVTGLIDWSGGRRGPVLYDVASAAMYLGGPTEAAPFLQAYVGAAGLVSAELSHLDFFRKFRWAIQASYFATRIADQDRTGIDDLDHNHAGLGYARAALAGLEKS